MTDLPGVPLDSGFRFRPASEHPELLLPPAARQRVLNKIESVRLARLRAAESAAVSAIG